MSVTRHLPVAALAALVLAAAACAAPAGEAAAPAPPPAAPAPPPAAPAPAVAPPTRPPAAPGEDEWAETAGWFTLHHDVARSGRTNFSPAPPLRYVWHARFFSGMLSPEIEPIVAEDLVFVGDWSGVFHALDAWTGKEAWTARAPGGVRHAACYDGGHIYFATIGDRAGGSVFCLKAKTGEKVWEFRPGTRGGFATSPALYRGKVYIGGRDKRLYCLDAKTGAKVWDFAAGGIYLQTCAARGGKVVVTAEDMVPRGFDADSGKVLWEGPRLQGDTCRFYYPVFWKDTVVLRTAAPERAIGAGQGAVTAASEEGKEWARLLREHGWTDPFWQFVKTKWQRFTPEKYRREQEYLRDRLKTGDLQQTLYVLGVADGKERLATSVVYAGSENGYSTPTPPPVDAAGNLYVLYKTVYSQYEYPIRQFDCLGTLDYATGLPVILPRVEPSNSSALPITADESNNFTVGGDRLYDTHDHVLACYDFKTRKVVPAFSSHAPESWGGVLLCSEREPKVDSHPLLHLEGPTAHLSISNEWNGTSRGAVALYKDHVWWVTGSMVVCLKGGAP